jgi:hypothetical protein
MARVPPCQWRWIAVIASSGTWTVRSTGDAGGREDADHAERLIFVQREAASPRPVCDDRADYRV